MNRGRRGGQVRRARLGGHAGHDRPPHPGRVNQDIALGRLRAPAMHRRWGQEAPDARPYSSDTEEEFHRAMERWKKSASPEVFVFVKHVDPGSMADPGPQIEKVIAFRKSLDDSRQVLCRFFADEKAFTTEVDRHLRACARGEIPKADVAREAVVLPLEYLQEVVRDPKVVRVTNAKELPIRGWSSRAPCLLSIWGKGGAIPAWS